MIWLFKAHLQNTQSPLISQLANARPSIANNNRAVVLNQLLHAKPAARHKSCKYVTRWCCVMSQSHRIKGGTTDETFQGQCCLWERRASVSADIEIFNFKMFYQDTNFYKTQKERKKWKGIIGLFNISYFASCFLFVFVCLSLLWISLFCVV